MSRPGTPPDPPTNGLPFVFVDRSLGRIQVPNFLRAAGIELVTLAGHYGIPQDEDVEDTTRIAESATRGWVAFPAAEGAARFIRNLKAIERARILGLSLLSPVQQAGEDQA